MAGPWRAFAGAALVLLVGGAQGLTLLLLRGTSAWVLLCAGPGQLVLGWRGGPAIVTCTRVVLLLWRATAEELKGSDPRPYERRAGALLLTS